MHRLMCELMSESEMDDLVKRRVLMEQLMEGKTQRSIAKDLGVSLCKITRGAKVLKQDMSTSRRIIKQRYCQIFYELGIPIGFVGKIMKRENGGR